MSDDPGHKERKGFEPPPWERAQFEELARRRAAEEQIAATAAAESARAAAESTPAAAEGPPPEAAKVPDADPAVEDAPGEGGTLDERAMDAMLFELSAQEGPTLAPVRGASKVIAGVMGLVGTLMTGLATFLGVRAVGAGAGGDMAGMGAVFIAVFGLLALGAAAWMWMRADGSQGS
jgi:hypothetical protein